MVGEAEQVVQDGAGDAAGEARVGGQPVAGVAAYRVPSAQGDGDVRFDDPHGQLADPDRNEPSSSRARGMDAQSMDLADDSADGMLYRFGLMLMPEPQRLLNEARRVLRPGGRLTYAVFGTRDGNPWITTLVDAIEETGHRLSSDMFGPGGSFFSLPDHDRNRELLTAAGFADVHVDEIGDPRTYDDFDEYWDHHTHVTGPIAVLAETLSPDEAEVVREALRSKLARFQSSAGYEIPSAVVVARAA